MSEPEANREREQADDGGKMSFFDHLTELRTRIIWSLIPAAGGLAIVPAAVHGRGWAGRLADSWCDRRR